MRLLASLTNRIFIAASLLAVVTTGVAVYLVGLRATSEAEAELARGLREASGLVAEQRRALTAQSLLTARLLADLPTLKGAVETRHAETVAPIAAAYRTQVGADLLAINDRDGAPLAAAPAGAGRPAQAAVSQALAGRDAVEFLPADSGVLLLATVPISIGRESPEMLGTLSLGVRLDTALAERFKRATRSEVAFALSGEVRAATLPTETWPALAALLASTSVRRAALGDAEYMALATPLSAGESVEAPTLAGAPVPVALVLQSRTERLGFLRTVYAALGLAAATAIVLAVGLSFAVARTITRPLAAITATMRDMAATGDLTRKIPMRAPSAWQDEDARLLATTFNTLTDSIARFQREAAQKERLLSLGRLSTVIAHEVRNPLMIIKATLRGLGPNASPAVIGEAVKDIDEEVDRLNRIVHDVLDFSRPPSVVRESADLVKVCRDAAAAATVGSGPGITMDLPEAPLVASTDAERLRTALVNVLSNARQAVDARERLEPDRAGGNGHRDVRLSLEQVSAGHVRLRVSDHGTGIKADDLPHVFEPYFTTRRAGTGLGLPIARNIVEGLGGTIALDSAPGRTTIEIVLPL
jgi:signal transduction histidine kinase